MQRIITGLGFILLSQAAMAQAPVAGPALPAVAAPAPVEAAAAQQRAAAQEKAEAEARDKAQADMREQQKQIDQQREANEKQAKKLAEDQAKADEKRAAEVAADAEKAKATQAAAAAAPVKMSGDARDVAMQVCLAEAKSRATALGATNVTMNKVEDTDRLSDGRASVRAKVNVVTMNKGKPKVQKKTIKCDTRNGTVTQFEWD